MTFKNAEDDALQRSHSIDNNFDDDDNSYIDPNETSAIFDDIE